MNKALFISVIAVVLAALVGGLAVVGGPGHARAEKRDDIRRADLRRIADRIICEEGGQAAFKRACRGADEALHDPLTGAAYEVTRRDGTFKVCATFEVAQQEAEDSAHWQGLLHFEGVRGCLHYVRTPASGQWVME